MTIHIVEDDFGVRDAFIALADGFGHRVFAYADGESFLEAGEPAPDDVIFVDLGLPGVPGADVIRWLRSLSAPPQVVAISGRSRADIDAMLRDFPGLQLLRKPLAPDAVSAFL